MLFEVGDDECIKLIAFRSPVEFFSFADHQLHGGAFTSIRVVYYIFCWPSPTTLNTSRYPQVAMLATPSSMPEPVSLHQNALCSQQWQLTNYVCTCATPTIQLSSWPQGKVDLPEERETRSHDKLQWSLCSPKKPRPLVYSHPRRSSPRITSNRLPFLMLERRCRSHGHDLAFVLIRLSLKCRYLTFGERLRLTSAISSKPGYTEGLNLI